MRRNIKITKRVSHHTVSACIINHQLRLKSLIYNWNVFSQFVHVCVVVVVCCYWDLSPDATHSIAIARVYVFIESISNVHIRILQEITFMAIALVSIQVNDQHSLDAAPLPGEVHHQSDVWVDTEATAAGAGGVMVATREIDGPATVHSELGCVN